MHMLHCFQCESTHAGAKLDVQLMKNSKSSAATTFSRSLVLQRLHGHVSLLDTLKYRLHLLQVVRFAWDAVATHAACVMSVANLLSTLGVFTHIRDSITNSSPLLVYQAAD